MVVLIVLSGKTVQSAISCIALKDIFLCDAVSIAGATVDQIEELFGDRPTAALRDRFC